MIQHMEKYKHVYNDVIECGEEIKLIEYVWALLWLGSAWKSPSWIINTKDEQPL